MEGRIIGLHEAGSINSRNCPELKQGEGSEQEMVYLGLSGKKATRTNCSNQEAHFCGTAGCN